MKKPITSIQEWAESQAEPVRILMIDDDADFLFLTSKELDKFNCEIQSVNDTDAAVAYLREKQVDLVLLDLAMPGQAPLESYKRIRAIAPQTSIAVFSGNLEKGIMDAIASTGFAVFIQKPDRIEEGWFKQFMTTLRIPICLDKFRLGNTAHRIAAATAVVMLMLVGCIPGPQKGGTSDAELGGGVRAKLQQPENPKEKSEQSGYNKYELNVVVPAGSTIDFGQAQPQAKKETIGPPNLMPLGIPRTITFSRDTPLSIKSESGFMTRLGGTFLDAARALGARLAAARPVQYAGIAFIVAAGFLFYFGWPKIAVCAVISGVGMIVLSMIIPGNERWILGGFAAFFIVASAALLIGFYKGKDEDHNGRADWFDRIWNKIQNRP